MEFFGAPQEVLDQVKQEVDERFIIHPDNWATVELFLDCATQWRWSGGFMPMKSGLDYTALAFVAGINGVKLDRDRMLDIRVMEAVALGEFSRRASSAARRGK